MIEPAQDLLQALGASSGVVCAVGAGGKKTTLYNLFLAHPGRVGLTATAFTSEFPNELGADVIIAPGDDLLVQVPRARNRRVAYAQPSDKPHRVAGLPGDAIAAIHEVGGFDLTLVKADGARMRRIKAPAEHEPGIPECADTVLLVLSALAIGKPLSDKVAHRPERIAALSGLEIGQPILPAHLAALFTHQHGLLQGTEGRRVIPVLNMVDDDALVQSATEVAELALRGCDRFDRFVLTANRPERERLQVIRR